MGTSYSVFHFCQRICNRYFLDSPRGLLAQQRTPIRLDRLCQLIGCLHGLCLVVLSLNSATSLRDLCSSSFLPWLKTNFLGNIFHMCVVSRYQSKLPPKQLVALPRLNFSNCLFSKHIKGRLRPPVSTEKCLWRFCLFLVLFRCTLAHCYDIFLWSLDFEI